jgi:hypothetical protein
VHSLFALYFISCIGYVYYAALDGGDCPMGPIQRRLGDESTFFELFLPPRLARLAVPFLGAVTGVGFVVAMVRTPRRG